MFKDLPPHKYSHGAPTAGTQPGAGYPPVLLALANYYGTLAAARSLGAMGIRVTVAERRLLAPARWSRFVSHTVSCPDVGTQPDDFLAWLLAFGERKRHVLIATSDDLAWLFAQNSKVLRRRFVLETPPVETIYTLLSKWRLREAALAAGLESPESWLPKDEGELERIRRSARFPLLIKPQTQVFLSPHLKGRVVLKPDSLRQQYNSFAAAARHAKIVCQQDPWVTRPMLQSFEANERNSIYNLSGYVDCRADLFVAMASRKVLQVPRLTGVGLCFEEEVVEPTLAAKLRDLCERVGYYGIFEAEFIRRDGRFLFIDFNPRLYGEMAFDIRRGLDLPAIAYLSALGDTAAVKRLVDQARDRVGTIEGRVYCNHAQMATLLLLERLSRIGPTDARQWLCWSIRNRERITNPAFVHGDVAPGFVDAVGTVLHQLSHPRSTLRAVRER